MSAEATIKATDETIHDIVRSEIERLGDEADLNHIDVSEVTDMEDLFSAHIGGMDAFARGLEVAHGLLNDSPWEQWRAQRYASFDAGAGKDFASGKLGLADLAKLAAGNGEPVQASGKQERYENLLNQYLLR